MCMWNLVPFGRSIFDAVKQLELDVSNFANKMADELAESVSRIGRDVEELINRNNFSLTLCLQPSCAGYHINNGMEQDLLPDLEDIEILASHCMIAHATR